MSSVGNENVVCPSDKLADAVRVLLYGNGDLYSNINDVASALAEYDGVDHSKHNDDNRLSLLVLWLERGGYEYFSGEEWNK